MQFLLLKHSDESVQQPDEKQIQPLCILRQGDNKGPDPGAFKANVRTFRHESTQKPTSGHWDDQIKTITVKCPD